MADSELWQGCWPASQSGKDTEGPAEGGGQRTAHRTGRQAPPRGLGAALPMNGTADPGAAVAGRAQAVYGIPARNHPRQSKLRKAPANQ